MIKHIMLAFLSDIKMRVEGENVVISCATYTNLHDSWGATESTNESAIRYVLQEGWKPKENQETIPVNAIDMLFVFTSNKVSGIDPKTGKSTEYMQCWDGKKKLYRIYYDAQGHQNTHFEFFKHSLEKRGIISNIDEHIKPVAFNEEDTPDKAMDTVADMAEQIQSYVAAQEATCDEQGNPVKCVLHVDLSGGMRHVNMMMLELMRLMDYNGITIGNVLYSNYDVPTHTGTVETVTDVYKLFDLISGAEEFVRFGSVSVMQDYFAHSPVPKSQALQELLNAMEGFAEAIKLCHRGSFENAIGNLRKGIEEFTTYCKDDKEALTINDKLMQTLICRIEAGYAALLKSHDQLDAIQWCLERDYLQQALTLYTETIPQYMFDKKIISFTTDGKREVELLVEEDRRELAFYALNNYDIFSMEKEEINGLFNEMLDDFDASQDVLLRTALELQRRQKLISEKREETHKKMEQKGLVPNMDKVKNSYYKNLRKAMKSFKKTFTQELKVLAKSQVIGEEYELQRITCLKKCKEEFFHELEKPVEGINPTEWYDEDKMDTSFNMLSLLIEKPGDTVKKYQHNLWMQKALDYLHKTGIVSSADPWWKQGKELENYLWNTANKDELLPIIAPIKDVYVLRLYRLFDADKLILHTNINEFGEVWNQYGKLKKERNKSNHARTDDEYMTSIELKKTMEDSIKLIKKLSLKS